MIPTQKDLSFEDEVLARLHVISFLQTSIVSGKLSELSNTKADKLIISLLQEFSELIQLEELEPGGVGTKWPSMECREWAHEILRQMLESALHE